MTFHKEIGLISAKLAADIMAKFVQKVGDDILAEAEAYNHADCPAVLFALLELVTSALPKKEVLEVKEKIFAHIHEVSHD